MGVVLSMSNWRQQVKVDLARSYIALGDPELQCKTYNARLDPSLPILRVVHAAIQPAVEVDKGLAMRERLALVSCSARPDLTPP